VYALFIGGFEENNAGEVPRICTGILLLGSSFSTSTLVPGSGFCTVPVMLPCPTQFIGAKAIGVGVGAAPPGGTETHGPEGAGISASTGMS